MEKNFLEIKVYPDDILRSECKPVKKVGPGEKELMRKMAFAMKYFQGVGLAAPQIGVARQIVVADIGEGLIALANPEIVRSRGEEIMEEACLSVPGASVEVKRARILTISGVDPDNNQVSFNLSGFIARVLQHEVDHLKGKLIIDYDENYSVR